MNRRNMFVLTVLLILTLILCVGVACAPTQNQGNPSGDNNQNGGQISSGDNQTGDSEDKSQNPSFPSGDTGSENIGGGDSDTDEIEDGDNNSDIGEEKPEVKYPSTIAEMTIEQKKILTDYLDGKYKEDIAKSSGVIGAKAENTSTIGYTLKEDRAEGFFETINESGKYFYKFETGAEIDIYKFFEAIDDKEDPSEFAKFTFENYIRSSLFLIPLTENEYSANAENAYAHLNLMLEAPKVIKPNTIYFVRRLNAIPEFESGNWYRYEITAVNFENNKYTLHMLRTVTKDYDKLGHEAVDTIILDEKYLKFGSENTIYIDDLYTYKVEIDGLKYGLYDGEATIMGYTADLGMEVIIPNSVTYNDNTYSVTKIGSNAFEMCKNMQSIVIPASVSKISPGAFASCSSLTGIEIPSSVTSIGIYAFGNCSSLTIYCEAESQPSGWSSTWNLDDRPVVWEYKG